MPRASSMPAMRAESGPADELTAQDDATDARLPEFRTR